MVVVMTVKFGGLRPYRVVLRRRVSRNSLEISSRAQTCPLEPDAVCAVGVLVPGPNLRNWR
eukprot:10383582-Prorocentrum_lima.AAC.1